MIKKSEDMLKREEFLKSSKNRRLFRKKDAEKHNSMIEVVHSFDKKKYEWNKSCKRCFGRGYTGLDAISKHPVPCKCLKKIKDVEKKK